MSLSALLAGLAMVLALLAGGGWWCYSQGKKTVMADWMDERLNTSETARKREQAAQKSNERIDRDYQTEKTRLIADKRATDDRLRNFQAASADTATSTTSGTDDPYPAIANQCAVALVRLDEYAQSVAGKATALQRITSEVCLKQ